MGADSGVGPGGARPNSNAASATFLAAAGTTTVINFEGIAPITPAPVMNLGGGVTYTPSNPDSFSGIYSANSNTLGFNTTAGGSTHLRYSSSTVGTLDAVFTFANPVDSFGAFFTNVGGTASILFNDGTAQVSSLTIQPSGSVQFWGVTMTSTIVPVRCQNHRQWCFPRCRFSR
jgi:hypothetical protein